ncbi:MAG: UDP-2,4-diacetamido-2,4,6-trideoxy-beta-L-altropyranose hydrolase [Methylobacter sp.]|nr:UDP-2,4-diacetamido-2,4,6-trideoxy-beta-L-altropyranose hydrolase [Candidatus Methylobacter titanis]
MKIAFRVDASVQIGSGHFMRCLTLADELTRRGAQIRFVSRYLPDYLACLLAAKGYELAMLDSAENDAVFDELAHAHWLGCSQAEDAKDAIKALSDRVWDWLIVDHYALDSRWESRLRQAARKILAIDDIADRPHDCDVLLDQNFYADMNTRYTGKVPDHCRLLLGPRYALLREEFRQLREQVEPRTGSVHCILVFFGGVDADNYTSLAIQSLIDMGVADMQVDVVIGAQHPCREAIEAACLRPHFTCHVQTNRMAELMAAADLSIGAGGGATWERCCLGLPTIAISTAENQRKQIVDAASEGLVSAPDLKHDLVIGHHISSLIENSCLRQLISRNAMQAVDGKGVLRVITGMGCSGIDMRMARPDDSESLFVWRNHPAIRAVSRNSGLINCEDHSQWFASLLSDPNRVLLIGLREGVPIGVVRFDIQNHRAEVSIYLVPGITGCGRDLLRSAEMWFAQNRLEVNILRADVLGANERSRQLFLSAGYEVESISYFKKLQ